MRKTIRRRVIEAADSAADNWVAETPGEIYDPEVWDHLFPEWVALVDELEIDSDEAIPRYTRWSRVFHDHVENAIAKRVEDWSALHTSA